jgi:hypothetical protein
VSVLAIIRDYINEKTNLNVYWWSSSSGEGTLVVTVMPIDGITDIIGTHSAMVWHCISGIERKVAVQIRTPAPAYAHIIDLAEPDSLDRIIHMMGEIK